MTDIDTNQKPPTPEDTLVNKPTDQGSIGVSGVVKIFDPNTNETIVETRA